eukprot:TRINITY_DN5534_c0_g4_i1.p1 TRINITY_DN5534_c0_g4~~TRINITY_DN5534_c0_g4_i1.p1  ORF type:complete len:331 (+),score=17.17 TRINITY_DN5534_c0_g4_i1:3-995(+)
MTEDLPKIRLKTCHQTYLCILPDKNIEHSVNKNEESYYWHKHEANEQLKSVIFLQSSMNTFLTNDKGKIVANRNVKKSSDVFLVECISKEGSKYAFKTPQGEYISAHPNGMILTNRYGPQQWETFILEEEPFAPPNFGCYLHELIQHQLKTRVIDSFIPKVLEVLSNSIVSLDGYTTEGIFRVSGEAPQVMKCRNELQRGNYNVHIDSCHDAATLYKLFLRELKDPLIPTEFYTTAIRVAAEGNVAHMQEMLNRLDRANLAVLDYVLNFLRTFLVQKVVEITKMNAKNLAVVFAPNLLKCPSENPMLQMTATQLEQKFVVMLLELPGKTQ